MPHIPKTQKLKLQRELERVRSTTVTVEDLDYLHHRIDLMELRLDLAAKKGLKW